VALVTEDRQESSADAIDCTVRNLSASGARCQSGCYCRTLPFGRACRRSPKGMPGNWRKERRISVRPQQVLTAYWSFRRRV
jgi:hypothetical protein